MKPGGTRSFLAEEVSHRCFNPLPAMKPGGTIEAHATPDARQKFQSAPGDEAGRNLQFWERWYPEWIRFNPLPAMKPGGTLRATVRRSILRVSIRSRR